MRRVQQAVVFLTLGVCAEEAAAQQSHPFLIMTASDRPLLEARAAQSPWKEMRDAAVADCTNLSYSTTVDKTLRGDLLRSVVSACTVAYLADPPGRAAHRGKLLDTFNYWDDFYGLRLESWSNWHPYVVAGGNALFYSLLSFDIIWNDLTPTERSTILAKLGAMGEWYWSWLDLPAYMWWPLNMWGARGIWALFTGDRPRIDAAKQGYRAQLHTDVGPDGVYREGSGYAWSRLGADVDRTGTKAGFMDVLEFTGEDTFYGDPEVARFYEWLLSGGTSPVGYVTLFGDTHYLKQVASWRTARMYTMQRFSKRAAANVAWALKGAQPATSDLLTYVLVDQPLPPPEKPSSGLWPDGGAAFWDADPADGSLMAALWNRKSQYDHSHKEVNAIYLAGYGEHLLANSGYAGFNNGCVGSTWDYANNSAFSGNTVTIDGVDHVSKSGAGLSGGFFGLGVDYASAHSGAALPNGAHERSLVLVHAQDGKPGYAVLFDEVQGSGAKAAQVMLHPMSAEASTIADRLEYRFRVSKLSGHDVFLSIFLGTEPSSVAIKDGAICTTAGAGGSLLGKYLSSSYSVGSGGRRQMVTVLFPSDATHGQATFARLAGSAFSGAKIDLGGGLADVAVESDGGSAVQVEGATLQARAALFRRQGTAGCPYFLVRQGTAFDCGGGSALGFSSLAPVSLLLKGSTGRIASAGARVTFRYPGVGRLDLDGTTVPVQQTGAGEITADIPAGTHTFTVSAGPPTDASPDQPRDAGPLSDQGASEASDRGSADAAATARDSGVLPSPPPADCSCRVGERQDGSPPVVLLVLLALLVFCTRRGLGQVGRSGR
jgi:hypothetical protein